MLLLAAQWEFDVLDAFIGIRNEVLTYISAFFTALGDEGKFWIGLSLILAVIPKTRKIGLYTGAALLVQLLLGEVMLKHIIMRERPFVQDPSIDTIIGSPFGKYSFPSGHSSASAAASVSIFLQNKKLGIPMLLIAILIMLSRLYFAVHFPTDVIAGAVLGTAVAIAVFFMLNYLTKRHLEKKKTE